MSNAHLSRHFLGFDAGFIAPVDHAFHAGSGDIDVNLNTQQTLIAMGGWSEEAQESQLRMYNITTEYVGKSSVKSASINLLASFPSTMRLTALTSHKRNDGTVLMISGATDGALRRLRMSVPRMFAGDPSSIRMAEEDLIGGDVSTCGEPHSGAITSIAIHPGGEITASVGIDGCIAISDLTAFMSPSSIIYDSKQLASFSYCQWLTMQTLASTSLQGALQLWDVRQPYVRIPASQTLTLSKLIGQCQPLTCLAGFPGQPHIVTSGDAGGRIVSWDLRSDREPMFIAHADGNITGLRYSSTSARLWMTTLSGTIGIVEEKVVHTVFKEPIAGITDFCVPDCATPSELYALNDQEALIFLANAF